jgi:hypothetical protein
MKSGLPVDSVSAMAFVGGIQAVIYTTKAARAINKVLKLEVLPEKMVITGDVCKGMISAKQGKDNAEAMRDDLVEISRSCEK